MEDAEFTRTRRYLEEAESGGEKGAATALVHSRYSRAAHARCVARHRVSPLSLVTERDPHDAGTTYDDVYLLRSALFRWSFWIALMTS